MRLRISLRSQLFTITLLLAVVPYLGYKYIWEMESYLRKGQENTMIGTARAVATMLHEQPTLLDANASYRNELRPGTDLYAPPLPAPVRLDGNFNDWQSIDHLIHEYGNEDVVLPSKNTRSDETSVHLSHMVGRYGEYLYARFTVIDDMVIWRPKNSLYVEKNDHLLIGLKNNLGELERYVISPYSNGWVNAYRLKGNDGYTIADNALFVQGEWIATEQGVNIELRLPLDITSHGLAFAYMDVDDYSSGLATGIGTANPNKDNELGTVVTPSPEIERILSSLLYADSRIWVVDRYQRVLAKVGDIQSSPGIKPGDDNPSNSLWHTFEANYLLPLYYRILTRPPNAFIDTLTNAMALEGDDIQSALIGKPDSLWRLSEDNKAVILSSSHPIFYQNEVIGAVVIEQTTHGIRTLRNRALEDLFNMILAVMLVTTMGIVFLSHRTTSRTRALRDATESIIDDNGKIVGELKPVKAYDEIGDLWLTFSNVLSRLNQYNTYLESMASRLSHELRTPVAVVKSSLDMLPSIDDSKQREEVIERAKTGIERLSKMLNSMSEATRLEQLLEREEREPFTPSPILTSCIKGYQHVYTERQFEFEAVTENVKLIGSPDLFVQMLDKVIANAVEFSQHDEKIKLRLWQSSGKTHLSVTNLGPILPDVIENQLLHSMVSIRPHSDANSNVHLGLGLYIAQIIARFHHGNLSITNLPDNSGVCVVFSFSDVN
ncbi:proteobacterial dedicated sortase system histidine kinase [Alteromonas sp. 5E99-2]|uniref:proteobacterial dedicated sortase system histidine kinase n=1 Tax=Alteromonas sp. 5E99-2 TaxID=2817683 RepID=UPI001A980B99|nr:proteobacterial dedicated sortase system histidine kinase [Alteromonas sp. 5E99-2]MBO1256976.1 proteobacterial dedicated sortase system histidine kinase [Alteromonas sp. 5E99-2]